MGDKRRFDMFAAYIAERIPAGARIADVAAGKGQLSFRLRLLGYNVTTFEPAPRRGGQVTRLGMVCRDFRPDDAAGFDAVVGMHPDAATDCILEGAARHGAIGIVCPCCIRPNAWVYWGNKCSHAQWESHLREKSRERGLRVIHDRLRMNGASTIIEARP